MATAHNTLSLAPSKPEKLAQWLFTTSGNYRQILGFLLIAALTYISIRFNYELGKLSAVDETSKQLLPAGYALLDLCCLFLSGFVGVKSKSPVRKLIAWCWFCFLLCLSLWAAASFTLSVDHRLANRDLEHAIEQKREEVDSLNNEVTIWRENVANAVNFKTKHQNTLNTVQEKQRIAASELHNLEISLIPPTMAIYHKAAPYTPLDSDTLSLVVRLLWAGAMTLSPLVIVLLVVAELTATPETPPKPRKEEPTPNDKKTTNSASWCDKFLNSANDNKANPVSNGNTAKHKNARHEEKQNNAKMMDTRAFQRVVAFPKTENVVPILGVRGNNQHTETPDLNGLKHAKRWLEKQQGRVTRAKISYAAKVHGRKGITRIIDALIDEGLLVRSGNGQLYVANTPNKSKEV